MVTAVLKVKDDLKLSLTLLKKIFGNIITN
jgi:hypothetical protein